MKIRYLLIGLFIFNELHCMDAGVATCLDRDSVEYQMFVGDVNGEEICVDEPVAFDEAMEVFTVENMAPLHSRPTKKRLGPAWQKCYDRLPGQILEKKLRKLFYDTNPFAFYDTNSFEQYLLNCCDSMSRNDISILIDFALSWGCIDDRQSFLDKMLMVYCEKGFAWEVAAFIKLGANLRCLNTYHQTILHLVTKSGNAELLHGLLDYLVDNHWMLLCDLLDSEDVNHETPVSLSATLQNAKMMNVFLDFIKRYVD